jgi:hypothetical protein
MKLQSGENRFRILGPAIDGSLFWQDDGKGGRHPVRRRRDEPIEDSELGVNSQGQREQARSFLAFPVWNYKTGCVQVLELTQITILGSLEGLALNEDWGDPINKYDIAITKTGTDKNSTKYTVTPFPPKPTPQAILDEFASKNCNLDAMFDGGYPFDSSGGSAEQQPAAPSSQVQIKRPIGSRGIDVTTIAEVVPRSTASGMYWQVKTAKGNYWINDADHAETAQTVQRDPTSAAEIAYEIGDREARVVVAIKQVRPGGSKPVADTPGDDEIPF